MILIKMDFFFVDRVVSFKLKVVGYVLTYLESW